MSVFKSVLLGTTAALASSEKQISGGFGEVPLGEPEARAAVRFVFVLIAALSCALTGCSDSDSIANGTGSNAGETELASVSINITNSKNTDISAKFWSIDKNGYSLALDAGTQKKMDSVIAGSYLLELRQGDTLSAMRWLQLGSGDSTSVDIKLERNTNLKGNIRNGGKAAKSVKVTALDKEALTDSDGNFEIKGLPEGIHSIFVEDESTVRTYQMKSSADTSATPVNSADLADGDYILFEDFEDGRKSQTLVGRTYGKGWWYICTDSKEDEPSQFTEETVAGNTGKALHVEFDFTIKKEGHYGVVGFNLGDGYNKDANYSFFDLRGATAISFDAKGTGKISLQVIQYQDSTKGKYQGTKDIALPDSWERITIPLNEFENELTEVNTINILVTNNTDLYIDNIRLEGIAPYEWMDLVQHVE